jgi:hypothetical protein
MEGPVAVVALRKPGTAMLAATPSPPAQALRVSLEAEATISVPALLTVAVVVEGISRAATAPPGTEIGLVVWAQRTTIGTATPPAQPTERIGSQVVAAPAV